MTSPPRCASTPRTGSHLLSHALCALLALFLSYVPAPTHAQDGAPPPEEDALSGWIPSVSFGAGASSRRSSGAIRGIVEAATTGNQTGTRRFLCGLANGLPRTSCLFATDTNTAHDYLTLDLGLQLMAPALDLPLRPRGFLHAGGALPLSDRIIASDGMKVSDFDFNGLEPDVRLELEAQSGLSWFAGVGVAAELPIDLELTSQRVWLKLSFNYFEEQFRLRGEIVQGVPFPVQDKANSNQTLTVRSIGPGLGVEALLWNAGPVTFGIGADFMVSFPLAADGTNFVVEAPGSPAGVDGGPVDFDFDFNADDFRYTGLVNLRMSWTGF